MQLTVKQEFKKLIPPLTFDEFKQLEANILNEGIRDPLTIWGNVLLDGHNRYEIATKHDIPFTTVERFFDGELDAKIWMINNQFGRRNLSNYQRSVLALEMENVFSEKAKANLVLSGTNFGKGLEISTNPIIEKVDTRKELAKVASVSDNTIAKVKVIQQKATDTVKEQLATGELTINKAYQEIKSAEKKEERKALIQTQIDAIEKGELPELKGLFDVISVDPPWAYGREYDPETSRVANPYPEMSVEQIKEINLPFTDNAIVFLWTTHKFLPDAFDILKHWGFDYKATIVWNKERIGMGAWFRMQCEFCLFAVKGKPYWDNTTERDIITEARREHSRKPDAFFDMVNKICIGRKLEYFSRESRDGWSVFGNDTEKF